MSGLSLVVASRSHSLVAVCGLLVVVSLTEKHESSVCRLQQLWCAGLVTHGMWDLPGPEIEPVSSALVGGFLPTGPLGSP